ncbi:MAG: hypothetical protein J0H61_07500 [Alphaproteobacteria bacterium]|nr:hypothetical protein [Alphaproteobacteria bacterium]
MIVETRSGGAGNVLLSFILGGVLVAVAIIGFFLWDNYKSGGAPPDRGIQITVKK